ncbi:hypothetical protein PHLGIDRAFT_36168 [Phlebiopsis gigantea 11061_1 CR5-6]|uniref:Alpha/beta hydrolase fold-3 domain-containing protein n=1 Tax=Phlebiopsis gigantea (strain 11061_1 CR5-6) TaxID=745531 RepID=A0A0C3PIU3_PHLG1|nr:hypothetical protein PHLGIDRAFT_36168 [Phlebiopsis gigantea 11061_1 CR5-6]
MLSRLSNQLLGILRLAIVLFVRLPYWTVTSLPSWSRPRPSWSLKRTLLVYFFQSTLSLGDAEPVTPNHKAIEEGPGVKASWVPPVPDLIRGDVAKWAQEAGVQSERVPGYWFEKKGLDILPGAPPRAGEKVIYSLHGGAYTKMSAHPSNLVSILRHGLMEHTHSIQRLFNIEYRLATRVSNKPVYPFPTQLIDAVAGYNYLVKDVGFAPENIIVTGDSAGGNLAIVLIRYLLERKAAGDINIPDIPSALLLFSPWVDLEVRQHNPNSSAIRNIPSDYLNIAGQDFILATSYFMGARPLSEAASNPYISPAPQSSAVKPTGYFEKYPRTLIVCGGAETLQDQSHILHKKMVADLGAENVQLVEYPDAIHDFCVCSWHEPERSQALELSARWMEDES